VATAALVAGAIGLAAPRPAAAADPPSAEPRSLQSAAAPAGELARGEIVDPVTSLSDPEQSYALYLPTAYDPGRRWPVLLVLDARGRGKLAAEVFEGAAERYGWIVLSSNGSRSDDTMEPNERAFRALLGDAERRFAVDPRRFYLAGF
jgi:hypothetical protein